MFDKVMNSSVVTAVSLLLGFLGVILAVVFYLKGKPKRELSWVKGTEPIVINRKSVFNGLTMTYNNKPFDDLSETTFIIWNSGNTAIEKRHFYTNRPLCIIHGKESTILEASISYTYDNNNWHGLDIAGDNILLDFECIENKKEIQVKVLHSGNASNLTVDGSLKEGIIVERKFRNEEKIKILKRICQILSSVIAFALIIALWNILWKWLLVALALIIIAIVAILLLS